CNLFSGGCGPCGGGFASLFQRGGNCSASAGCDGACGGDGAAGEGSHSGGISEPTQAAPGIPVEPEAPVELTPTPAEELSPTRSSAMPSLRSAKRSGGFRYSLEGAEGS